MEISFKPMSIDDLPLLETWMAMPHWREWWGDAEGELADISNMIDGKDTTRPFLFLIDGKPTGYIQYWHVGHQQTPGWIARHPWLADLPAEAIGVDISIGETEKLSKGIGTAVLSEFVRRLEALGYETILIDPDPKNKRAVRSYEKAGFEYVKAFNKNTEDCMILQYKPNSSDERKPNS